MDVLVVGAGPSGLFTASELARHGIRARVVERESAPHRQARATGIQPGTLEVLQRAGLAPWPFLSCLPQWRTEEIIAAHLTSVGVAVERGIAVTAIEPGVDAVRVRLERPDGASETIEAAYVVSAGGAHSLTRQAMDEALEGDTYPGIALAADVRLRGPLPRDAFALVVGPRGFVLLAALPDDRWITFIGYLDERAGARLAAGVGVDDVARLLAERLGDQVHLLDVAWASVFRAHRRIAPRLAGQRCFLVGDAGHVGSPLGGEGLNAGLHDGADLAWKLALTLQRRARPVLLESYAIERAAADRHALDVSDMLHRGAAAIIDALASGQPLPDAPADPATVTRMLAARSMLDISYAGSPIVGEHLGERVERPSGPASGERYSDRHALAGTRHHVLIDPGLAGLAAFHQRWHDRVELRDVGGVDAARAGISEGGVVLIRPDGCIGFRAVPGDASDLRALDAHLASYLVPAG